MTTYGLLIFDGAEELDFAGPWEVFTVSAMLRDQGDTAVLIAERPGAVRCAKGMQVLPAFSFNEPPSPGCAPGPGRHGYPPGGVQPRRHRVDHEGVGRGRAWVTSVCTGALLRHEAGPARGRRVATHHAFEDTLEARGDITVVRDARYVVDGNLVTSQGVSAGIDMALWLAGRIHGRDHARAVRRYIQCEPAPPYLADEPLPH